MVFSGFLHQLTDRHDITEILLKVALNTINQTTNSYLITYISTMPLIIHVFYENFEFFKKYLKRI
jgi:hypothetical protein